MIESFLKDLHQSLRMLWQSPGFTAAAVAVLRALEERLAALEARET